MEDGTLVRGVLAGEESAFEEFFASYFPRLYRFALTRVGGNEDAAEEVVQRALVRALRRLETYRAEAPLFTWLCTICRREIDEWRRREMGARAVSLSDERPEMRDLLEALAAVDGADPEVAAGRSEVRGLVQLTLDHLPAHYGDVLEWKYVQGLSVQEIATRLGIGYKAAESLLTRARTAFREGFPLACTLRRA